MTNLNVIKEDEKPWYHQGLRFKCTGCGKCCSGSPGFVFLTDDDIEKLLNHLNISYEDFVKKYTKTFHGKLSLRDDTPNYGCIFLKEGKFCSVYTARPMQCKTYPFWLGTIASQEHFEEEAQRCEGINHPDAPLLPKEHITRIAAIHAGLLKEEP